MEKRLEDWYFDLNKETLQETCDEIVNMLKEYGTLFANIQIDSEFSQYDVIISYKYRNQGMHQRGIRNGDLLISIVGHGTHGFTIGEKNNIQYYQVKLQSGSELLMILFNHIRMKLK